MIDAHASTKIIVKSHFFEIIDEANEMRLPLTKSYINYNISHRLCNGDSGIAITLDS